MRRWVQEPAPRRSTSSSPDPVESASLRALVDSGADRTVFPSAWADAFGIDLATCKPADGRTAGGDAKILVSIETVTARFDDRRFGIHPCFMDGLHRALLGRDDMFEHFIVTIDQRGPNADPRSLRLSVVYPGNAAANVCRHGRPA